MDVIPNAGWRHADGVDKLQDGEAGRTGGSVAAEWGRQGIFPDDPDWARRARDAMFPKERSWFGVVLTNRAPDGGGRREDPLRRYVAQF